MTYILGISAYYHDSAAALLHNGEIVAASQEERFSRIKGDPGFPTRAVDFCLKTAGISERQIDYIVFYENPTVKFERIVETYHQTAPFSLKSFLRAIPSWLTSKLWVEREILREMNVKKPVFFCDHHLSHAASAFFPSPFKEAAVLTVDGVGEWSTSTIGIGKDNRVKLIKEMRFPNSLGLLYSAFTYYTGFKINSGEYKLMGLAPFGEPRFLELIESHLVDLKEDGSLILNQAYFNYLGGLKMTNNRFSRLFGGPPRRPESEITQRHMDIAASIQAFVNKALLRTAEYVFSLTGKDCLTLAGGVALNVVSTGKISVEGPFKEIWIQPAAGDAGGALGAAYWLWYEVLGNKRVPRLEDSMRGSFLGFEIPPQNRADDQLLKRMGAKWESLSDEKLQETIAKDLAEEKVVAVARGPAEFGPRALGARSILGHAGSPQMQSRINRKVKFREGFRPFAPMVLEQKAQEYFSMKQTSPYMLMVFPVREEQRLTPRVEGLKGLELLQVPRSRLPAVTHVDYSARVQTVRKETNSFMTGVLERFEALTGLPVVVNTSFNVRGEPMVNTAEDAYRCFMATDIDSLVIGNRYLRKSQQSNLPMSDRERKKWLKRYELD